MALLGLSIAGIRVASSEFSNEFKLAAPETVLYEGACIKFGDCPTKYVLRGLYESDRILSAPVEDAPPQRRGRSSRSRSPRARSQSGRSRSRSRSRKGSRERDAKDSGGHSSRSRSRAPDNSAGGDGSSNSNSGSGAGGVDQPRSRSSRSRSPRRDRDASQVISHRVQMPLFDTVELTVMQSSAAGGAGGAPFGFTKGGVETFDEKEVGS